MLHLSLVLQDNSADYEDIMIIIKVYFYFSCGIISPFVLQITVCLLTCALDLHITF